MTSNVTEAPKVSGNESVAPAPQALHTLSRERLIFVVVAVMLGMLLSALDQTIVGTAMPRIIAELNGLQHYAWVFTAYMLTSTATMPLYGRLSDTYGRRPFFVLGLALFTLGSMLSGQAHTMTQLMIFRGVQGLGAGAMMPVVQAIVGDIFPPAERGKWQGAMMAVFGLATIVGPTLGGYITDNWGWRWVFYVNLPVGILAIIAGWLAIPAHNANSKHNIDFVGAALLVLAAVPMLLGFSWAGTEYEWGSATILGLFGFALVMWIAFFLWELRAKEPIISPRLFKHSIFTVSAIASFIIAVGMFGAIMYLPLFVQGVIGDTATDSGAVLTPMMLGFIISSIVGGQLLSRWGRYKIIAIVAFLVGAFGMWLMSRMGIDATNSLVVRNMVVVGFGLGVQMSLFTIVVQNAFPFERLGEVTASLSFFRSIGGTIGVAVLGTLMTNRFTGSLVLPQALTAAVPPAQLANLKNPQLLMSPEAVGQIQQLFAKFGPQGVALFKQLMDAIRQALATSITGLFTVSMGALLLGLVVTLFLKEIPLRKKHSGEAAPTSLEL